MPPGQAASDPRALVTPDAFEISPEVLGLPLASPSRRGLATLVDLALIGIITVVTKDIGAVVGVLVALVFARMALKSPITRDLPTPLAWAFRLSVGCLGLVILAVSFAAIWMIRSDAGSDDRPRVEGEGGSPVGLEQVLGGLQGGLELTRAADADAAEEAATLIAISAASAGMPEADMRELLESLEPSETEWSDEADEIFSRAVARALDEVEPARGERSDPDVGLDTISPEGALLAYAALLETGADSADADTERLRRRAVAAVASDTLEALESRLSTVSRSNDRNERRVDELQDRVEELEQGSGLARLARDLVDELGLAFGWGSIYFAVLLPWWKGQTPGKRLLGVRVLRLDGEPISWWFAFERAGGYAAGFATGLLGFAQVYWDPNRQGIHDKIAGTVVVREGAPRPTATEPRTPPTRAPRAPSESLNRP